ncbi:MAG: hypothetical protein II859_12025 [Bacteroidales bacterium]|nr:hypothetical protein [Bacteroidales bacterium]
MKEIFLKQPRRGKTREAQLTLHKAKPQCGAREVQVTLHKQSVVWGSSRRETAAVWGLLILATLFLTACNGDKFSFTGDYSYKLSGEVKLTDTDGETTFRLIHRNGQMNILRDKSDKNRYVITMNEMNGGCYTMSARLDDDNLQIDQHEFATNVLSTSGMLDIDILNNEEPSIVYRVTASGNGKRSGDILIIKEIWRGNQSGNLGGTLLGNEMTIIAEKN